MSGWIGELDHLRENEDGSSRNLNRMKMAIIKQFAGDNSKRERHHELKASYPSADISGYKHPAIEALRTQYCLECDWSNIWPHRTLRVVCDFRRAYHLISCSPS
jgi:hypothetical protein